MGSMVLYGSMVPKVPIHSLRLERDHEALTMIQKVKVCLFEKGSAEAKHSAMYASAFVTKQLNLAYRIRTL